VLAEDLVRNRASELRWRHDRKQLRRWIAVAQELSVGDPWGMAEEEVLALTDAEDVPVLGRALACARVEEIRDRIHAMQPGRPSVAELARSVGVHPVYLTRSFRRRYGCSIAGYVRRIRVEQIAALLISRECPPLAAVAHELGFADQSHLCRTFAAELGVSPGNYRRTICVGASGSQ
jgi:AraC-like DNA-binding protein